MRVVIRDPSHDRKRSLGFLACWWIDQFCVHGPGDVEGEKVQLDDELCEFIVDCYTLDRNGRRLYDSAFFSRAKGRAKSELAGFLVLFEALGPCRFERWAKGGETYEYRGEVYTYEPGEPIGRRVVSPFIRCLATEEGQAGNTYDNVYFNLSEGMLGEGWPPDAAGLTRTYIPGGGEIRPSTSGNASKDGGKETFSVFDETHLYVLPELVRMYATVRRNAAKRKAAGPWTLETSTMYQKGEGSVAEKTHDFAEKIASGKVRTTRLLFDHREAPPDVDLENEEELYEALREVYGPFADVMDLSRIVDEIWDPRNSEQDSRRYFLNQSTDATDAWVEANEWAAVADPTKILADKEMIVIGFDGSRRRSRGVTDATALIGCRVSDGHLFELGVWEQPDGPAGDDWQVPANEVDFEVQHAFRRFKVVGMYCDPAKWETWIAKWEAEWSKQLLAKATQQHPMEWWVTGGRSTFIVRALTEFHDAIGEKELTHSGEYTLTRHVLNARRRPSKSGIQIAKENPESPKKIDAAFAAVLAWQARTDAIAAGALLKKDAEKFVPRRIR